MENQILDNYYQGHCIDAYRLFGAHPINEGVRFTVYAPNASAIFVIGEFNDWQQSHQMHKIDHATFQLVVHEAKLGQQYKYRVYDSYGNFVDKCDPVGFYAELRPNNASVIYDVFNYNWNDTAWMESRSNKKEKPLNIYEVHLGSWIRYDGNFENYRTIAEYLAKHVKEHGFTHVEIMPISEHPFDGSWGYQPNGYFSITSRYGTPEDFKYFVDHMHKNGIGVIVDFVPIHFVKDAHGLAYFDGTPTYEYPNDKDAHSEWGTLNFDLWKEEVRSFLMSAAAFYLDIFHCDGIRIDAVKNAIYWQGNSDLGVNEGALNFLRRLNFMMHSNFPNILMFAEDSSDFPFVCKPTFDGGLGFDYKWDLGWMNDTLKYLALDPIYRQHHHHQLTFSMMYFYNEQFMLPLSHDEVVHGKGSIFNKLWGDYHQKFAQLKAFYVYQFTHPGKKLNFMGNEFAQIREWDENREMDWNLLDYEKHQKFNTFFKKVSSLYTNKEALHENDFDNLGFRWIDADNASQNLYTYERKSKNSTMVVIVNFSPNYYENQRVGVEFSGSYRELLNTDNLKYGGYGVDNGTWVKTSEESWNYLPYSIQLNIAPFSAIILEKRHRRK